MDEIGLPAVRADFTVDATYPISTRADVGPPAPTVGAVEPIAHAYQRIVKPTLDRLEAMTLLLLLAPVLIAVAIAVRLSMGGGVIYRQMRVGHHGAPFTIYKFRTMTIDRRHSAHAFDGDDRRVNHKDPNDPRLTSLGRFLRRTSLDELPQLWNVVLGSMSLVGPRPELPSVVARYELWQHARHEVKPGLTGSWQVRARGGGRPMHECTELDLDYVEKVGFVTDLLILLLTIPAVLGLREGL